MIMKRVSLVKTKVADDYSAKANKTMIRNENYKLFFA